MARPRAALLVLLHAPLAAPSSGETVYLDAVTTFCYQSLMADGSCCRDRVRGEGVSGAGVLRPGAAWACTAPAQGGRCLDEGTGYRGQDQLWWPDGADCTTPRLLYVHGGDWMFGGPREAAYDALASKLARETGALVMAPDFRLAPVGNYTDTLRSLLEAWRWLAAHGPAGKDCSAVPRPPTFVAGDSSGAGSGLSLLLRLQRGGRAPELPAAGFLGFSAWTNLACDTPSYYSSTFARLGDRSGTVDYVGDILARGSPRNKTAAFREVAEAYLGAASSASLTDPEASPFHMPEAQLRQLPPLYLAVSGTESRTGDSIILGSRAAKQGIPVALDVFHGMWHAFPLHSEGCRSGHDLWQGRVVLSHAGDFVRQVAQAAGARDGEGTDADQQGFLMGNAPQTNIYYAYPQYAEPWVPVRPLSLRLLERRWQPASSPSPGLPGSPPPPATSQGRGSKAPSGTGPAPGEGAFLVPAAGGSGSLGPPPAAAAAAAAALPGGLGAPGAPPRGQALPASAGAPAAAPPPRAGAAEAAAAGACALEAFAGAYLTGAAGGAICAALALAGLWRHCSQRHGLFVCAECALGRPPCAPGGASTPGRQPAGAAAAAAPALPR